MARSGLDLMITFLARAWMPGPDVPLEPVTWADVTKLMFENAASVSDVAQSTGHEWSPFGVDEIDRKLREIADSGEFALVVLNLDPAGAEELWRRWQYAIIASEFEAQHGQPLNIAVPQDAPPELKGAAVMLYVLGGPARDYPPGMFVNKQAAKSSKQPKPRVPRSGLFAPLLKPPRKPRR